MNAEEVLWQEGIINWEICLDTKLPIQLQSKELYIKRNIEVSLRELELRNVEYFSQNLKHSLLWRLLPEFQDELIFIDIETTGLYKEFNKITTIATYDGKNISYFVGDSDLEQILNVLNNNKIIVSYNGKSFDIPFIAYTGSFRTPIPEIKGQLFRPKKDTYSGNKRTLLAGAPE
ncbi:MAG: ribonuclease H-like domain-containing protein [Spirochaetales bacterium]|nr:ribonuclease H-like domain-containing protein [Spirochaetales bacterium]